MKDYGNCGSEKATCLVNNVNSFKVCWNRIINNTTKPN